MASFSTSPSVRLFNDTDWEDAEKALIKFGKRGAKYPWVRELDWAQVFNTLRLAMECGGAYVVEGYLVVVDVVTPWYTRDKVLQEGLVLRIRDGGTVDDVVKALDDIAKLHGCVLITTGDTTGAGIMSRAYSRAGYKAQPPTFFKRTPNG